MLELEQQQRHWRASDGGARSDSGGRSDGGASTALPVCKDLKGSGVSVSSVSPADGATHVLRMPTITVNFTDEIDSTTFTADHVKLSHGSTSVPLVLPAPDGGTNNEAFQPAQELAYLTEYVLAFDGLKDDNGKPVSACQ